MRGVSERRLFQGCFLAAAPQAIAFFKARLPPEIVEEVDWSSLKGVPSSFVKLGLQQVQADLLFAVKISGRNLRLYLLFEHQSTVDPTIPLRLPFLPKFHHALLDLTRYDPEQGEDESQLRSVMQLMKLARERQLSRYFDWLVGTAAEALPEGLLKTMLLYALQSDSDLDAEKIYHELSPIFELRNNAMSVAEKLIAEGLKKDRVEGQQKGLWIGKIQALEDFLEMVASPGELLDPHSVAELETMHQGLNREYERRFRRR